MQNKIVGKYNHEDKQIDVNYALNDESNQNKDWTYLYDDVEDQGFCGSCWAFSIVGVIEGLYNLKSGNKIKLSKKYVVDCDSKSDGCEGGWVDDALSFIKTNGIYKETDYTLYNMKRDKCSTNKDKKPYLKIGGYKYCKADEKNKECNPQFLDQLIEAGPFGTYVDADDNFMFYSKGIWKPTHCHEINHAVIVVARNNERTKIRNSWGDDWGNLGYADIARGKLNDLYGCGVEEFGFAPTDIEQN
jgi:C1A family cysteine protease